AIFAVLVKSGTPTWVAAYVDEASVDLIDKLVTVGVALIVYQGLPNRFRSLFALYRRPQPA
ncbi:MAG TPA: hypothetical protein VOB72_13425, partial [Candidatus Dormibacteraeota bacterium]|nr:hypothetical protein [Candidatus Dormibacteraeota bacterium]